MFHDASPPPLYFSFSMPMPRYFSLLFAAAMPAIIMLMPRKDISRRRRLRLRPPLFRCRRFRRYFRRQLFIFTRYFHRYAAIFLSLLRYFIAILSPLSRHAFDTPLRFALMPFLRGFSPYFLPLRHCHIHADDATMFSPFRHFAAVRLRR
jgi:hypothetical protein